MAAPLGIAALIANSPRAIQILQGLGVLTGGAIATGEAKKQLDNIPEATLQELLKKTFLGPSYELANLDIFKQKTPEASDTTVKSITSTPSGVVLGPTVKEQEEARARQKKLLEPGKTEAPKPFGQLKDFSSSDTLYDFIKPEVKSPPTTTGGITVSSPGTPVSQPLITTIETDDKPPIKVLAKDKNTKQYIETVNPTKIFGERDVRTINYNKDAPVIDYQFDKPTINQVFKDSVIQLNKKSDFNYDKLIKQFGLKMPDQKLLNDALQGDADSRYWYQKSGKYLESLVKTIDPNATDKDVKDFIDIVSLTSGGVKPKQNLKLALGVYSDLKQNQPIETGFRTKASLDKYLENPEAAINSPKFGNFTDTMTYFTGITDRQPNVVNDLQMAKIFGVQPDQLASNPELYNVMTNIMNNLTAEVNKTIPEGQEKLQPYELQSLMWSASRGVASNYKQVGEELIKDLYEQGINIQTDVMKPDFSARLQKTIEPYKQSVKATIEVGSFLTPEGQEIEKLINQYGDNPRLANDVDTVHKRYLNALITKPKGQPSLMEDAISNIIGEKASVSRMETGLGSFEGKVNYNVRIPLTVNTSKGLRELNPLERRQLLALIGKNLNQAAMAGSSFRTIDTGPIREGEMETGTFYAKAKPDSKKIAELEKEAGIQFNVRPVSGGFVGEIISFTGAPDAVKINNAFEKVFGKDKEMTYTKAYWKSDYVENNEYEDLINGIENSIGRGVEETGTTRKFVRNIPNIEERFSNVAKARDADYTKITNQPYVKKLSGLTKENLPETDKPTFQGNQIKTWEVGNFKNIEEAKQTAKDF
jgi:hypothetical protein